MLCRFLKFISFASVFYFVSFVLISCEQDFSVLNRTPPIQHDLDTTSHEFTWEIIEFPSPYGSASFYDVAIINENDIWAVGEIYADSARPGVLYNAVHWNGERWELKRISTNSVVGLGYSIIRTIFVFSSDNIWMFSDAGSYCHWNGSQWTSEYVSQRQGGIYKIWGSSQTSIYFVGTNCNITHYNGRS